ncbi:MAG TPA: hypothetical protein PK846_02850 [Spirochaetota bacterium]|nr:hypothetical protein [Spirochaetota bacterium]
MQFFFLLLFNVFLGAVLYLVISLKLERSATDFRERRFRKEMDEIIKEFNTTAERNISLLESRIRQLRRLMEKTGEIRTLDITLDEEDAGDLRGTAGHACEPSMPQVRENPDGARGGFSGGGTAAVKENNGGGLIKKGLLILSEKIIDKLSLKKASGTGQHGADKAAMRYADEFAGTSEERFPAPGALSGRGSAIIEKDMTVMIPAETTDPVDKRRSLSAAEIEAIVAASDDRYRLVSVLFDSGCPVDEISRYSGIPAGEVRLVLNLNRSRDASGA